MTKAFAGCTTYGPKCFNYSVQFQPNANFKCSSDPNSTAAFHTNFYACQGGGTVAEMACQSVLPNPPPTGLPPRAFFRNGMFHANSQVRMAHLRDGTGVTVMLGETKHAPVPAGSARTAWDTALRLQQPGLNSNAPLGLCATTEAINSRSSTETACDPTKTIADAIDIALYRELGKRKKAGPVTGIE